MEQNPLVSLVRFLFADELQRVAQALDGRLDGGLDVLALQLQAVDAALNVFEPGLGFFEQQIRAALRLRA